ncbi:CLUMA_CG003310, isoform A [Clunio marinus]|uniref:CLUMA_CG003310, isoform A n=1 Tax=Clunio marinus TaxID=568069 RepID=A0A1J1HTP2_9DIPT|nr:CLUMA_CG003310, isoform A [Clunio marinus]
MWHLNEALRPQSVVKLRATLYVFLDAGSNAPIQHLAPYQTRKRFKINFVNKVFSLRASIDPNYNHFWTSCRHLNQRGHHNEKKEMKSKLETV